MVGAEVRLWRWMRRNKEDARRMIETLRKNGDFCKFQNSNNFNDSSSPSNPYCSNPPPHLVTLCMCSIQLKLILRNDLVGSHLADQVGCRLCVATIQVDDVIRRITR